MAMSIRTYLILAVVACTANTGCFWFTTKHEGEQLQKEVKSIDGRLAKKEKSLEAQIKRLNETLAKAEKQLTLFQRQNANLSADFSTLSRDVSRIKGLVTTTNHENNELRKRIDELKSAHARKVKDLETQIGELSTRIDDMEKKVIAAKKAAETPEAQFAKAKGAYDRADYDTARKLFKAFVIRNANHNFAARAQYLRAETYYRQKKYVLAIREYQRLFVKYPKDRLADDGFWRAGQAAEHLKRCDEARAYYATLRRKYKRSEFAKRALKRDKLLRKWRRNRKKCNP
jgi:TolA-binding protein